MLTIIADDMSSASHRLIDDTGKSFAVCPPGYFDLLVNINRNSLEEKLPRLFDDEAKRLCSLLEASVPTIDCEQLKEYSDSVKTLLILHMFPDCILSLVYADDSRVLDVIFSMQGHENFMLVVVNTLSYCVHSDETVLFLNQNASMPVKDLDLALSRFYSSHSLAEFYSHNLVGTTESGETLCLNLKYPVMNVPRRYLNEYKNLLAVAMTASLYDDYFRLVDEHGTKFKVCCICDIRAFEKEVLHLRDTVIILDSKLEGIWSAEYMEMIRDSSLARGNMFIMSTPRNLNSLPREMYLNTVELTYCDKEFHLF